MCSIEQQKLEVLDDISYLQLMQIAWSYSEMSDLKKITVEPSFSQFAKNLIVFERLLVGGGFSNECNDIQEIRARLAESFQDFINAVESSETSLPDLKERFLKGIKHILLNFTPLQQNKADPACESSEN